MAMAPALLLSSHSITLSWTALHCLLCISSCLAAFCTSSTTPLVLHENYVIRCSDNNGRAAFVVGRTASWPKHPTTSLSSLPARQNLSPTRRFSAASSDDDATTDDDGEPLGMRARVRERVTKASKRVRTLVSASAGEVVGRGGAPIAGVLTDAAAGAAELARSEEVRAAARDALLRRGGRPFKTGGGGGPTSRVETQARIEADARIAMDAVSLAKTSVADAFDAAERALGAAEEEIRRVRTELENAKRDASLGLAVAEKAAAEAAQEAARQVTENVAREVAILEGWKEDNGKVAGGAETVTAAATATATADAEDDGVIEGSAGETAKEEVIELSEDKKEEAITPSTATQQQSEQSMQMGTEMKSDSAEALVKGETEEEEEDYGEEEKEEEEFSDKWSEFDVSSLAYDDVDYTLTEMSPPFINEDECLVPGEPIVRVEKAPQNSRRIFAGIDIPVSVDDVWDLLTDYPNLQQVVPNLVVNEVLQLYEGSTSSTNTAGQMAFFSLTDDENQSPEEQCRNLAEQMKGAVLRQVGGAKVVGINFSARTKLEVREWPGGMPDFAHFEEEVYEGKSRSDRVREARKRELTRYVFPRPFALSSLPHKDISMQSLEDDDGEFRMYQGVWRMQPLPGCSPPGGAAMRLTYAVEVSPRPYLPVALVEGRIAQDLCSNLKAIRDVFEERAAAAGGR